MAEADKNGRRRPRVLLLAYACSPNWGSEPGTGWNYVCQIGRYCDAWVICEAHQFAAKVRDYLAKHGNEHGLRFEFVPKKAWERFLGRIPGMYYLSYNLWHRRALRVARRLHQEVRFDLVHQTTIGTFREPGYLWKLDAPLVWGPVSGTQNFPWRFLTQEGLAMALVEMLRTVVNWSQLRFSLRVGRAARRASAILGASTTIQRDLAAAQHVTVTLLPDVGAPPVADAARRRPERPAPLRILWCGGFRGLKALSLLIEALAQVPEDVPYELRVLGDGPRRKRWQRLARRTGVDRHTTWLGFLPHDQALRQYQWGDVFVFTSLRDTTGNVILEALAAGLPVMCLDHQGAHDFVDEQCGIKIPVTTPRRVIAGIAEAIVFLARHPEQLQRLSRGALDRARELTWAKLGERMADVYRRVLGDRFVVETRDSAVPEPDPAN